MTIRKHIGKVVSCLAVMLGMSAGVYAQNEKVVISENDRQETVQEDNSSAMSDPAVLSDKVLEKDVMEADNFEARRHPLPDIEISRMRDSSLSRPPFAEKIQITNTEAFIPSPGLKPVPFIRNYYGSGTVWSHGNFGIIGSSSYHEHPFLLTSREAELAAGMNFGKLGIVAGVSATNYAGMYIPNMYQLGVGGQIAYGITENIGIVAYGQFYDKVPYVTMSAYPFVNTSHYGGYISIAGDVVGINLGAERYFDPMSRSWETLPIITPTIRIGDNASIGIPIGGLVRGLTSEIRMRNMPPPPSKAAPHQAPANAPRHLHR